MKKTILYTLALLFVTSGARAQQQNDGLPGTPQTESYVVTPVDTTSGVTVRKVSFLRSNNIVLVGNLFLPKDFDKTQKYPAILSIHPAGSVKEQSAGLYAYRLAESGFVTLAFDAAYAGESGHHHDGQQYLYRQLGCFAVLYYIRIGTDVCLPGQTGTEEVL